MNPTSLDGPVTRPPPLHVSLEAGVLTLTNTDAPWNRMSLDYMDAVEHAVRQAASDPQVRVLVFTAQGDENFSVGMDLKQIAERMADTQALEQLLDQRLRVLAMIESLEKPSIATLFGYCLGGGLELPLACHFRLAADTGAAIGLPEVELGVVPAWGGTARLTRCVGRDQALHLMLRARKIDGHEALKIGLVHSVHPLAQLKAAANALARELAAMPPLAVAGILRCVVGAGAASLQDALAEERRAVLRCAGTRDQQEGFAAFLAKRKPVFAGG